MTKFTVIQADGLYKVSRLMSYHHGYYSHPNTLHEARLTQN